MMMSKENEEHDTSDQLVAVMLHLGFAPANVYNAFYLEFSKTYADDKGRLARAVVQFDRPIAGSLFSTTPRLSGFTVLAQAHVDASREAVTERAPPVMQSDLLAVLSSFRQDRVTPQSMAVERCSGCDVLVAEYFVARGQVLCRTCKEKGAT